MLFNNLNSPSLSLFMANTRKAAIGFIFVTLLIDVMGWGLIIPVMPKLLSELKGLPVNEASSYGAWLIFAYAIMQFICAPIIGNLSDQYGRRPVLVSSLFAFAID
jgi:DHA1 family tetracycline resistance protein-like MFS transporter